MQVLEVPEEDIRQRAYYKEEEVRNKIPIPEPSELLTSPTNPQYLASIRIEDYQLKESNEKDHWAAKRLRCINLLG
jgi:hypothetical protein